MSQQLEVMFQISSVNTWLKIHVLASLWLLNCNSRISLAMTSRLSVGLPSGNALMARSSILILSSILGWKTSSMLNQTDGSNQRLSWKIYRQSISFVPSLTSSTTIKWTCMWEMKTKLVMLSMSISVSQWAAWTNNASVLCSDTDWDIDLVNSI